MMRILLPLAVLTVGFGLPNAGRAADPPSFDEVVKKVEAKFEPATAKPGQTVTLKVSVQLMKGWHTYPTVQPEKGAKTYTNKFTFPVSGDLVYVGELLDPLDPKEKSEPILSIDKMFVYPGGGTWEKKAVVLPATKAGTVTSKIKFRVLVCDKENCLPPKTIDVTATLKVAGDPIPVDPKYKAEIEKKK